MLLKCTPLYYLIDLLEGILKSPQLRQPSYWKKDFLYNELIIFQSCVPFCILHTLSKMDKMILYSMWHVDKLS